MKKIILAIIIILMTGCSVNYRITIDDNFKIIEKVVIEEEESFYSNYYHTTPINVLKKILDNYKDVLDEKRYNYYIDENNGNPLVIIEKEYANYDEYINNTVLLNDYFEKVNFVRNNDLLKISTEGFNPNDSDNPDPFNIENLVIEINSAYKVVNNNAMKYDSHNNIYSYNISEKTEQFNIIMDISTTQKYNPIEKYYGIFIVAVIVVVASWVFVIVKNKKKNK